ncbi:MAG TPA: DUF5671 domain-containing protein [Herpetosiphonaceae bacterium]
MATQVVRRLYIYAAAFLGLQLAAWGARRIIGALLAQMFEPTALSGIAQESFVYVLSQSVALLIVGLPLWLGHWYWAQRMQSRPEEQHSALRRLYGYAVLLIAMLGLFGAIRQLLAALFGVQEPFTGAGRASPAIGSLAVWAVVWRYHWRIFSADRPLVEATGATATLRRWYLVLVQAVGLGVASYGAVDLLHALFQSSIEAPIGRNAITAALPSLIAGLLIWLPHHLWSRSLILEQTPLRADETRSTLRQVYAALVITIAAVAALGGMTVLLYAVLLATLGGSAWRAVLVEHTQALATIIIACGLWWYHRRQLADEARLSEVEMRVDTARRVNSYLTTAIGLGALFFGIGGLISTLLRLALAPDTLGTGWTEPLSMYLALSIVALPVYGLTARSIERRVGRSPVEERTLSRRIYLYAALLFGIVAAIVTGVMLLQLLLSALLGAAEAGLAASIARWLGYTLVGAAMTAYYTLLLRRSSAARADTGAGLTIAVIADEALRQTVATTFERELPGATLRVVGPGEPAIIGEALSAADVLVVALQAALDGATAEALRGFGGRRLLLATSVPSYELIGAHKDAAAIVRDAARTLRSSLRSAPPVVPPTRSALPQGAT